MLYHRKLIVSMMLFAASASASPIVYIVTYGGQFGTLDASSGAFTQVGPTTSDPIGGLVSGPNGSLLGVTFGNNLESINPATGAVSVVAATNLGPGAATSAFTTGQLNGNVYETDGSNNIYKMNTITGAAMLIGPTGLPPCPSVTNPDDIGDEALFAVNGKLYLTFDSFDAVTNAVLNTPELYQINPVTGSATPIGSTAFGIGAALQVNGIVYAFTSDNTVLTLNVANGNTTFVTNFDAAVSGVLGAAPTPEPASFGLIAIGIAAAFVAGRRRFHGQ